MSRFEREDIDENRLPGTLGSATEDLRTTVESEVAKIVAGAEARAAEIEDQALEKASRIEQESERRAQERFTDSRNRVFQMLDEINGIERSVGEAVQSLRAEAERLTDELGKAGAEPFELAEPSPPPPPPEPEDFETDPVEEPAPVEEPPAIDQTVADWNSDGAEPAAHNPEVREMIRQQLMSLAASGRTRADGERMLVRFKQGEQYFDVLDEIYPNDPVPRSGLLRWRKSKG
jgi:hypothetical protein